MHPLGRELVASIQKCRKIKTFMQILALLATYGIVRDDFIPSKAAEFFAKHVHSETYPCDFVLQISTKLSSFPLNSLISSGDSPKVAVLVYRRSVAYWFVPDIMFTVPVVVKSCTRFAGLVRCQQGV